MRQQSSVKIIEIINKNPGIRVVDLTKRLKMSSQAVHRQLKKLLVQGTIEKRGAAPHTCYVLSETFVSDQAALVEGAREVLSSHPAILCVTLFGSQARKDNLPKSDIDLLVWTKPESGFSRQDIWQYWDRQASHLTWSSRASLVVRKLTSPLYIDTLLLDMPEEHLRVFDREDYFSRLKQAVERWREKNGSARLKSFGGKHAWKYSSFAKTLSEIDFTLDLRDVA